MCLQVTQLEELLDVRHSVFVVGGPGTGKSQVNLHINMLNYKVALFISLVTIQIHFHVLTIVLKLIYVH